MVVTGGRPGRLLSVPVQALWLVVLGLGIQIALEFIELSADRIDDLGFGLLMLSYALLLAFAIVNFRLRGMAIITVGLAMNAIAIGLNEGMPTRDRLVETRSGRGDGGQQEEVERPVERTAKERPESDEDLAPFLGQIIEVPENPIDEALAAGDLVIAVGVVVFFVAGGRYRRPRTRTDTQQDEQQEQDDDEPDEEELDEEEEEMAMAEATALGDPTPQPPPVPEPPPTPEP